VEWIQSPRIRTFVEKRFHLLFSKKKRSGSNVSSRLGNDQLSIHFTRLLDDLKSSKNYCPRKLFSGSNSSPKKSSTLNISPSTCVIKPTPVLFKAPIFFVRRKVRALEIEIDMI